MIARDPGDIELSDAWVEGDPLSRWRTSAVLTPSAGARDSGAVVLEVEPGCRLEPHTDSAEETIVVLAGRARLTVGDEVAEVAAGGLALVPENAPHEVRSVGDEPLRFTAVYASADITTSYERPVQPDGSAERDPLG